MEQITIKQHVASYVSSSDKKALRALLKKIHDVDVASAISTLELSVICDCILLLSLNAQAKLFVCFEPAMQAQIARRLNRTDLAALFSKMERDTRADLYKALDETQRHVFMPGLAQAERDDICQLASYPEKTVGALMTSSYATLKSGWTAKKALLKLQLEAPDKETIYQTYIVDSQRRLVGTLSLRELILAPETALIDDLMVSEVVKVKLTDEQELAAAKIRDYDLIALPVVNNEQQIVGIVTHDVAMDTAEEEATEDAQKSASIVALNQPVSRSTIWQLYQKRIGWLVLLVFGALLSGAGLAFFEETIEAHIALVFFMPLLVGSGGNAGSQSAALVVRALATGDIRLKDWSKVFIKDLAVASALGITMAATVYFLGLFRGGPEIAFVVAISMASVVLVGSLIGLCLPFILSRLNLDPATASGPLVTTIVDASGVLIYFGFATYILNLG